jgi:voltage-gated potassium channel
MALPLTLLVTTFILGTVGYYILGHWQGNDWSVLDCMFMTSISLTTVGYTDVLGASATPEGQFYTMGLLVVGMGATLYSVSSLTAFIVEGHLLTAFQGLRMERRIEKLSGHTIICGCGQTGIQVVEEHLTEEAPFVAIDKNPALLRELAGEKGRGDLLFLQGDATKEDVLRKAQIENASTMVAATNSDKDNLYLVVTSRVMNKGLKIVARVSDPEALDMFRAAGADHVISPAYIGGLRIASQVLRPHVVDFLDSMLRSGTRTDARVSEITIKKTSELAGHTIAESRVSEKVGLLIVAMRKPGAKEFIYSPGANVVLEPGTVVVVIGPLTKTAVLRKLANGKEG